MVDLVCIGNPAIDAIKTAKKMVVRAGSPAMNTAVTFSQLGKTAGIIGRIGKDRYGRFLKSQLKRFKIDCTRLRIDTKPTVVYDIKTTAKERYIKIREPYYTIKNLVPKDFEYVRNSKAVFYRLRRSFPIELLDKTKVRIYLSAHYYQGPPKDQVFDMREYNIAAVIGTGEEIKAARRFCRFSSSVPFIITEGASGSSAIVHNKRVSEPAFRVKVVDPTGAGDSFLAGYIFADLEGLPINERLRFGNACAALIIQKVGGQQVIGIKQVENVLKMRG